MNKAQLHISIQFLEDVQLQASAFLAGKTVAFDLVLRFTTRETRVE